jgi:hypothetical protein
LPRFKIDKASDWKYQELRQIDTLEELLALLEEFGHAIVVAKFGDEYFITIYDDYLE